LTTDAVAAAGATTGAAGVDGATLVATAVGATADEATVCATLFSSTLPALAELDAGAGLFFLEAMMLSSMKVRLKSHLDKVAVMP
jgi:hypothetical protein